MRKYEVIVTYDPDLKEEGVTEQLGKLKEMIASFDGRVIKEENAGRIPLAYPMNKKSYGTYVLLIVEVKPEFVAEFTRTMRINDMVLRFMTVVRDDASGESIKRLEERPPRPTGGRSDRFSKDRDRDRDRDRGDRRSASSESSDSSSGSDKDASDKSSEEASA